MATITQNPALEAQRTQLEAQYQRQSQEELLRAQGNVMQAQSDMSAVKENKLARNAFLAGVGTAGAVAIDKGSKVAMANSPQYHARLAGQMIEQSATGTKPVFLGLFGKTPSFDAQALKDQAVAKFGKDSDLTNKVAKQADRFANAGDAGAAKALFEQTNKRLGGKFEKAFRNNSLESAQKLVSETTGTKAGGLAQKAAGQATEIWGNLSGHTELGSKALAVAATAATVYAGKKLVYDKYFDPAEKKAARAGAEDALVQAKIQEDVARQNSWQARMKGQHRGSFTQGNAAEYVEQTRLAATQPAL